MTGGQWCVLENGPGSEHNFACVIGQAPIQKLSRRALAKMKKDLADCHSRDPWIFQDICRESEKSARTITKAKRVGKRIVAAGTTSVGVLESALDADGALVAGPGRTRIFICPPYQFRCANGLLTNFHLPRSTLLMLVSPFAAPG